MSLHSLRRTGDYELDFRARTVLANGTVTLSDPATFHFRVQDVPEPSIASVLLLSGLYAVSKRRRGA